MHHCGVREQLQAGLSHQQAGRLTEAESIYRAVIDQQPDNADALHLLGRIAFDRGDPKAAMALIEKAIALRPSVAAFHNSLGMIRGESANPQAAVAAFRQALQYAPNDLEIQRNLGQALLDLDGCGAPVPEPAGPAQASGAPPRMAAADLIAKARRWAADRDWDRAIAACQSAVRLAPKSVEAWAALGACLAKAGQNQPAMAALARAIHLGCARLDVLMSLCMLYWQSAQFPQALALCERALEQAPHDPELHLMLGNILRHVGSPQQTIAAYQQAIELRPDYAQAHNNLALVHMAMRQPTLAEDAARRAIELDLNYAEAHSNLANILKGPGTLDEAIAEQRQAIALKPELVQAHSNLLFTMNYHPGCDPDQRYRESLRWAQQHAAPLAASIRPHANSPDPHRRLRLGYVSPSLKDHAVTFFLESILAHHDHDAFEVYIYNDLPQPDAVTRRLRAYADHWRQAVGRSDAELADLIRQDGIDILVDLSGHTGDHRLLVFARKPAPVQVSYLEYPPTTGLGTIDCKITDACADPPGDAERYYTERLYRLEPCGWCYRPGESPEPAGQPPCLARGHVTFGSFNNLAKINRPILSLWARILGAVPGSRLLVLQDTDQRGEQRMIDLAGEAGIDRQRVDLVRRRARPQYLQLYSEVDIALDSYPYNGHTTSCDTLWMGVPLVSLVGPTHISRVGLSLLRAVGLEELVAHSAEQYVGIAVQLAQDRQRLQGLRSTIRPMMARSCLREEQAFSKKFEAACRQMWQWFAAGRA